MTSYMLNRWSNNSKYGQSSRLGSGWNIRYNCATLLMISFMISVVPPPMLRIRESR